MSDTLPTKGQPTPVDGVFTRFAPSPTGHLHVGGARTALFCWAFARGHDGTFLLRVEDTDQKRSSEAAVAGILEDLKWLGIEWQEGPEHDGLGGDPRGVGPFFQADRVDQYNMALADLLERGRAYPAFETAEELEANRKAAQDANQTYRYDRAALEIPEAERISRMMAGEPHVVRFKAPDHDVVVADSVLGEVRFAAGELDDFVIRKADGFPTYHFAVVVDDEAMGVSHVLRGQEHLQNTPRHVALQQALGYRTPTYAHLPLIFNPDNSKMSKRDKDKAVRAFCKEQKIDAPPEGTLDDASFKAWMGDKRAQLPTDDLMKLAGAIGFMPPEIDVEDFRRSGYLPHVLCNYLALLGWNPGEKNEDGTDVERFTMGYLVEKFGLDRIGKSASKFDREKLMAFNADEIQNRMSDEQFADAWRTWLERYDRATLEALGDKLTMAAAAARQRTRVLREAAGVVAFALRNDFGYDEKAVNKVLLKNDGEGLAVLRELAPALEAVEPFEADAIEAAIKQWCEAKGLGMGKAAQPLRVAMTGGTVSPGLGQTLELVGKQASLDRVGRCLSQFAGVGGS
ncbi:MAG: glutamate--tRNA ligase [Phycisphaerales bacterium JB060]